MGERAPSMPSYDEIYTTPKGGLYNKLFIVRSVFPEMDFAHPHTHIIETTTFSLFSGMRSRSFILFLFVG